MRRRTPSKVVFRLPYGSVVTYQLDTAVWMPEWLLVNHELDLLPYRAVMATLADAALRDDVIATKTVLFREAGVDYVDCRTARGKP